MFTFFIITLGSLFEISVYKGMNNCIKQWIQLTYPLYLLLITTLLIFGSRFSTKLYRLTFSKAPPILATLFILSYTSMLQAITTAFVYTTIITSILSMCGYLILYLGGSFLFISLYGFYFLSMFNAIMLFTKPLMRFNIIYRFNQ